LPSTGIFFGLLLKGLILLGLPGFLLLRLPFPSRYVCGLQPIRLSSLFDPHCSAAALRWISSRSPMDPNPPESILGLRWGDVSGIDVWEGIVTIKVWSWKEKFDAPHDHIHLISSGASFPPLFRTLPNFPRTSWLLISSGSRDEILEEGILLRPVTLL